MVADGASSITVAVRVRPFTIREAAQLVKTEDGHTFLGDGSLAAAPPKLSSKGLRSIIKVVDDKCLVFDPPEDNPVQNFSRSVLPQGKRVKDQTFMFDRVFDENTNQSDVYEATTRNLLDSVLDGYNATVFAYGATGCGKTHTITGTAQAPGIIFLTMQELFERINELQEEKVVELSLSYLEIYNETIRDLLSPGGSKQGLMLREDSNQAVSVSGLSSHHPKSVEEVMDIIVRGNDLRTMSPTEANATSSRSHAVLQINVAQKDRNADMNEPHTMATLSIIDLAGSERASVTKNRGDRLLEGANINKSLLALGSCINALCDMRKHNHIPYRNSKLTRLLKFSLGGNCKTVMIVCVSPSSAHFDETQNTLRYANRAKNIQTKVTRNVYNVNRHVKDYLKKIDEQMALITELKQQQKDHEASSFVKFKKQAEKRDVIAREGITRIRTAYDNSAPERNERTSMMKKCRQIERRISLISTWVAGFDTICDTREEEEPAKNLVAMRKTAQGILAELESSRQHYHQRLSKSTWDRALETALQTGIRQLKEADGSNDAVEISTIVREAELLRSMADRETYMSMLEQEKGGDAALVQVLLQAHFETIAILGQIMQMSEEEAVQAARRLLGQIITACSTATSQVIKPEGGLPVTEAFPPTRMGTPKHRRIAANILGPSPLAAPVFGASQDPIKPSPVSLIARASPMKNSPRRRKLGGARKGVVITTPGRKSPIKVKRGVRWKDDTDDGTLVEFQPTPQPIYSSPEISSEDPPPQPIFTLPQPPTHSYYEESPPISSPELSQDSKPRLARFQAGFLTKKSDGSPLGPPPTSTILSEPWSSDSSTNTSPLREIEPNKMPHSSSLHLVTNASPTGSDSSDPERPSTATTAGSKPAYSISSTDAKAVRSAIKRSSSIGNSSQSRTQRRRSPTASGSPPSPPTFSAALARRIGAAADGRGSLAGVLSPRTTGTLVSKGGPARRTTVAEEVMRTAAAARQGPVRMSTAAAVGGASGAVRGSFAPGKGAWR
ncbi:kinesin-domain-containing protein [Microthyrium microscopicum]|uniref:Kinesin-domain-containing protein n=1 Tax=Microthyrium microscopicum TaxID=703497 RepID=A0A6A6UA48_9PEZI|nr:kinesin-domain-containing protein [Microthyrium microscopicum]